MKKQKVLRFIKWLEEYLQRDGQTDLKNCKCVRCQEYREMKAKLLDE